MKDITIENNDRESTSLQVSPSTFKTIYQPPVRFEEGIFYTPAQTRLVRLFEIIVASTALVVLSPLMLAIALLVKVTSKGPIFYSQVRIGENRRRRSRGHLENRYQLVGKSLIRIRRKNDNGTPFRVWKFRSMYINAEADGRAIWCKVNDPRVTPVGRFLRKTHLDELPQLFNILRGDMSLVGPRPERPELVGDLIKALPEYEKRLFVKPGVTGLAQTRHRADLGLDDVRKKIKYDLFYLQNRSFWVDLRIVLETIPVSLGFTKRTIKKIRRVSSFVR